MANEDLKNIYQFIVNTVRPVGLATLHTKWTMAIVVAQIGLEYYRADMLKVYTLSEKSVTLHWMKSLVASFTNMV